MSRHFVEVPSTERGSRKGTLLKASHSPACQVRPIALAPSGALSGAPSGAASASGAASGAASNAASGAVNGTPRPKERKGLKRIEKR